MNSEITHRGLIDAVEATNLNDVCIDRREPKGGQVGARVLKNVVLETGEKLLMPVLTSKHQTKLEKHANWKRKPRVKAFQAFQILHKAG